VRVGIVLVRGQRITDNGDGCGTSQKQGIGRRNFSGNAHGPANERIKLRVLPSDEPSDRGVGHRCECRSIVVTIGRVKIPSLRRSKFIPTILHISHHDHRKKNECLTSQTSTITLSTDPQTQGLCRGKRIVLIAG
jgi:hypothetical protein